MTTNSLSLQEQLKSEERTCRGCGYQVTNPLYERCPRCYATLPKLELFCQGCLHRSACPGVAAIGGKQDSQNRQNMRDGIHLQAKD